MKQFVLISAVIALLGAATIAQAHPELPPQPAPIDTTIFDDMSD